MALFRTNGKPLQLPNGYMYGVLGDGTLTSGFETLSYTIPTVCNATIFCEGYSTLTGNYGVVGGVNSDGTTTSLGNLGQVGSVDVSAYSVVIISGQVGSVTANYTLS